MIVRLIRRTLLAAALTLPLVAAFGPAQAAGERFVFVSHAPDSDSWWNTIKNALKNAEHDLGVKVEYRNPSTGDIADMARIIEQATASNPTGVITTIADYNVLEASIKGAIAKGIPVITVNSGTAEQSKKLGALLHIGQPEYDAGKGAGERAKAAGVTKFLCVNHYITNTASVERCQGYADALGVKLGDQMLDSGIDPTEVYNKAKAYLTAHPDTNGILTLGPNSADPTIKLLRDTGSASKYKSFISFDLDGDIATAIKDGVMEAAIDQQPYLQGYIPVAVLAIVKKDHVTDPKQIEEKLKADPKFQKRLSDYGLQPVYDPTTIRSGPSFITKDNFDKVVKFAGQYR
jgi:simple sugar transport system substrate-binding protein